MLDIPGPPAVSRVIAGHEPTPGSPVDEAVFLSAGPNRKPAQIRHIPKPLLIDFFHLTGRHGEGVIDILRLQDGEHLVVSREALLPVAHVEIRPSQPKPFPSQGLHKAMPLQERNLGSQNKGNLLLSKQAGALASYNGLHDPLIPTLDSSLPEPAPKRVILLFRHPVPYFHQNVRKNAVLLP